MPTSPGDAPRAPERAPFAVLQEPADRQSAQQVCAAVARLLRPATARVLLEVWSDHRGAMPQEVVQAQVTLRLPTGGRGWRHQGDRVITMHDTDANWAALQVYAGWSRHVRLLDERGVQLAELSGAGASTTVLLTAQEAAVLAGVLASLSTPAPSTASSTALLSLVPLDAAVAEEVARRRAEHQRGRGARRLQHERLAAQPVPRVWRPPPPDPLPGAERARGRSWLATLDAAIEVAPVPGTPGAGGAPVSAPGDARVGVLPRITLRVSGASVTVLHGAPIDAPAHAAPETPLSASAGAVAGDWVFHLPPVTARLVEGRLVIVEVRLEDPIVPAWDEQVHPSMRRKLEKQRSVFSTFVAAQREHVGAQEMDVRVDSGWEPQLGWVLPAPTPDVAEMEDRMRFPGWYVSVLRGAVGAVEVSAPVWWGQRERTPEAAWVRSGPAVSAPDGTLRLRMDLGAG
ncbi:hypothetical protein [Kineococcus sp. SYSU DK006]|uniref:hypothetical protein n=1 Tax=Kineococcus sp. SYSU DK006 TaxID=3383127 RepID=UPI003D7EC2A7